MTLLHSASRSRAGSCREETDCVGAAAGVCVLLRSLACAFLPGSISHRAGLGGGRICPGADWPGGFRPEVRTRAQDADPGLAEECLAARTRSWSRDPASLVDGADTLCHSHLCHPLRLLRARLRKGLRLKPATREFRPHRLLHRQCRHAAGMDRDCEPHRLKEA